MSLPADKKIKIYTLGNWGGGVNKTDPQASLKDDQLFDCLNAVFDKSGVHRWCGCEGVTAKDAVNDFFRALYFSSEVSGTEHLFGMWGGNLYEITPSSGAISAAIYNTGGTGELWGDTHWGKFYATDGTASFKVEGSTGYRIGIVPPTAGDAAKAAGGSLPTGTYKIKLGYARKVAGLNVLYSQGFESDEVTLSAGDLSIAISNFPNSADPQVNNKVVWMTLAGGSTYYYFHETGDNTSTSFTISSDALYNNAILYDQFGVPSGLPPVMTQLIIFDNRIFGYAGNILYYSLKATVGYDLERFPTLNKIEYPFQITGLFSIGKFLYINTAKNGVIIQAVDDLGARFAHIEKKVSFKFMRTLIDRNGGKLGFTQNGLQFFDGEKFIDFDYAYNIRTKIQSMYVIATGDFQPCGCLISRENRLEYHLSFQDTSLGSANNNRTYVLNLSQTFYQDNLNFKTPWEVIDRGFNYAARSLAGQWFFGQSFEDSSTIFKELATHTTQQGIYDEAGNYLTEAANMKYLTIGKMMFENLFSKIIFEQIRMLIMCNEIQNLGIIIADTPGMQSIHDIIPTDQLEWDVDWDVDWIAENQFLAIAKVVDGTCGYSWYFKHENVADNINFKLDQIQISATVETGRQI